MYIFDNADKRASRQLTHRPPQSTRAVGPLVGCYRPHLPSPFVVITVLRRTAC